MTISTDHVRFRTRQYLLELGWDVMRNPSRSPDLTPPGSHCFLFLQIGYMV